MHKNIILQIISGIFLLSLVACSVSEKNKTVTPILTVSPKPGDCIACHKDKEVISSEHVDTIDMTGKECGACHEPGPTSLWTKIPLSHIHELAGVSCKECHKYPVSAKAAGSTVCISCHNDEEALVEAASELPFNPHFSPHVGKIPDCNKCHHQHKASEYYCAQCHNMDYRVP